MSTRERWIVYPLLFMTLGIAMRDKVIPPVQLGSVGLQFQAGEIATQRLRCGELQVGRVVCDRLQSNQSECHTLLVNGPNGRPVVIAGADANTHAGTIETFTASGVPQVRLLSTNTGGAIVTFEAKQPSPQPAKNPAAGGQTPEKQSPQKPQDSGKGDRR